MSTKSSTSTSGSKTGPMTRSQIIKSYGGRPNFQYSFGLKMDPDSIEEGNAILDAFEQQDREDWEAEQKEKKDAKK
ncbi:hypothetical protein B0H14DRAFT_3421404 [Mycena olivaceomarginata]|uniref:Uncharacterized protein n=1 Tax=Mycena albidolilacea TaxID=1033008 RepID=A0AAD7AV28_9AGAR|nr:hypothetical protein DFH08DRAFT_947346 [Mycena albidolilacea]KAJ7904647.1 hypothetical protein B0H14DRAFT_3421404 [Mycena olivaceomarginata]